MSMCSYVEKRRQRYYFRVRLPVEVVEILGRTHVLGSLLTSDSRTAKIRASRFYFVLADFLHMLRLRMRDEAHSSKMPDTRAAALVRSAFALGSRYEAEQGRLRQSYQEESERLQRHCQAELHAMIEGLKKEWVEGAQAVGINSPDQLAQNGVIVNSEVAFEPATIRVSSQPISRSPVWYTLREAFLHDKPSLTVKTRWSYNQAFDTWKTIIGDKAISEIVRGDVKLFADHLRDRPNARGGQLNHKSIQRSLGHIKNFMSWAVSAGHLNDDHFGDVRGRDQTREERMSTDKRRAFTTAELYRLFTSSLFRSPKTEEEQAAAWFLLLGALTGARTEEIAEAPAELVKCGDVWCLDLRQAGTKTPAAPRLVPLLPELIELGLPAWAKRQADLGRRLVQPGAVRRSTGAWSKYLNRYIDEHVVDAPDVVLYSLRHGFRQMLRAANIGDELSNKIFGHEIATVGAGYGRNLSPHEAALVIRAVRPAVDLKHVRIGLRASL